MTGHDDDDDDDDDDDAGLVVMVFCFRLGSQVTHLGKQVYRPAKSAELSLELRGLGSRIQFSRPWKPTPHHHQRRPPQTLEMEALNPQLKALSPEP